MTTKIIDLLKDIADGKEVPKYIKYKDIVYKYDYEEREYHSAKEDYYNGSDYKTYLWLFSLNSISLGNMLNDTVEIIEEPKKLEKLKWNEKSQYNLATYNTKQTINVLLSRSEQLKKSLNEIIDKIKELENK